MIEPRLEKDYMMFIMSTTEMAEIMEENGLIYCIYKNFVEDFKRESAANRRTPAKPPVSVYHHVDGTVHVLRCKVRIWHYFRELEATNPLERFIRGTMVQLGELGQADEILRLYPSP